jgi:hypothetical protein
MSCTSPSDIPHRESKPFHQRIPEPAACVEFNLGLMRLTRSSNFVIAAGVLNQNASTKAQTPSIANATY